MLSEAGCHQHWAWVWSAKGTVYPEINCPLQAAPKAYLLKESWAAGLLGGAESQEVIRVG